MITLLGFWPLVGLLRSAACLAPRRLAGWRLAGSVVRGAAAAHRVAWVVAVRLVADIPSPSGSNAPPGVGEKLNTILSWSSYVGFGMCVLGLIAVGGLMALSHRRGQAGEHVAGLGYALAGSVLIGAAAGLVRIFAV